MIQEAAQVIARIRSLKKDRRLSEASECLEEEFRTLLGTPLQTVGTLSQTELLALVIKSESTLAVREKALVLSTLLNEAGDVAMAENRDEESRSYYLKGLHLLLDTLGQGEILDFPEFVPRVEVFVAALQGAPLSLPTLAGLMQHFERTREFGKAEDALFHMLELEPNYPGLIDFGISFYERLQSQTDENLAVGNLPRSEVETSLVELRARRAGLQGTSKQA